MSDKMRERDEAILAAVRKRTEESVAAAKQRILDRGGTVTREEELHILSMTYTDADDLAGREKTYPGGEIVNEKKPFPQLTKAQVRPSLDRLSEAGALVVRKGRGRIDWRLPEVADRIEQIQKEQADELAAYKARWDAVNDKLSERGLDLAPMTKVHGGYNSKEWARYDVPLETMEALLSLEYEVP